MIIIEDPEIAPNKYPTTIKAPRIKKFIGLDFPKKLVSMWGIFIFLWSKD